MNLTKWATCQSRWDSGHPSTPTRYVIQHKHRRGLFREKEGRTITIIFIIVVVVVVVAPVFAETVAH